jgi:superfamily II DNA or RNA helicase
VAPIEIKSGHEDVFNLWDRLHGLNVAQNAQSDKEARPSVAPASVPPWLEKKDADQLVKARSHTRLKKMSELVDATDFYKTVVEMYKEHAKDRRSTLVFCSRIKMVAGMVKGFNDAGVKAQVISATTRPVQREAILSSFKRAEYPVLINCQVLTQGFDMPEVSFCIYLFRSDVLIVDRLYHHGKTNGE